MKQPTYGRIVSIGAVCAVVATSIIGAAPANAAAAPPAAGDVAAPRTPSAVLSAIRADLVASGASSDVAAFDHLSAEQRHELASYFSDPAVASAATAASDERVLGLETVRTNGDFEWGEVEPSRNVQPFTQVTTSKISGYISGEQATAKCKVVVKRGVPTPWGTIARSTYSAVQRLSAMGNGAITDNRWE